MDYLYKDAQNGSHAVVVGEQESSRFPDAKKAVLQYSLIQYAEETDLSLMEIHIDTGRFHQIRCQLANAGMPILGDRKYGTAESLEESRLLGIRQIALCACEIRLRHPASGQEICHEITPGWINF